MLYKKGLVVKTGSYYELKSTDIKENGMTSFSKSVEEYTKNKSFDKKILTDYYKQLINKVWLDDCIGPIEPLVIFFNNYKY